MKTTISALPPPVVIPPRDVTIVVTEQEARDIKLFLGRQAFRDYDKAFKEAATEGTNIVRVVKSPEAMQSTCDALWRALNNVV